MSQTTQHNLGIFRWTLASMAVAAVTGLVVAFWAHDAAEPPPEGEPAEAPLDVEELDVPERFAVPELEEVEVGPAEELLERLRERGGREWPPEDVVEPVTARAFPEDLAETSVADRKEIFYRVMTPVMLAENARLAEAREFVEEAADRPDELTAPEEERLESLAEHYRVDLDEEGAVTDLLRRLDEIPVDMAMAQAANESGWGTSRFTREANNLFGEWTWTQEEGLIPERRGEGQTHRIRVFPSLQRAVRSYYFTLNVGHAYDDFREQREQARAEGRSLDGEALAAGLEAYSERGQDYVEEVRSMIRFNELQRLNGLALRKEEMREATAVEAEEGGLSE